MTGTADAGHMREALDVFEFRLGPDEVERIKRLTMTRHQGPAEFASGGRPR